MNLYCGDIHPTIHNIRYIGIGLCQISIPLTGCKWSFQGLKYEITITQDVMHRHSTSHSRFLPLTILEQSTVIQSIMRLLQMEEMTCHCSKAHPGGAVVLGRKQHFPLTLLQVDALAKCPLA